MKHFLEMIEYARTSNEYVFVDSESNLIAKSLPGEFWQQALQAQVFVIIPECITSTTGDDEIKLEVLTPEGKLATLKEYQELSPSDLMYDLPFQTVCIERLNGALHLDTSKGKQREDMNLFVKAILIHEIAPGNYDIWAHYKTEELINGQLVVKQTIVKQTPKTDFFKFILKAYIDVINSLQAGTAKVKEHVRVGKGKQKVLKKINQVIYITHKQSVNKLPEALRSKKIDWSHRWMVRGHWRTIRGLGKNREGVYQVPGMTWVTEFEKGDKELPLVKKVRVVA